MIETMMMTVVVDAAIAVIMMRTMTMTMGGIVTATGAGATERKMMKSRTSVVRLATRIATITEHTGSVSVSVLPRSRHWQEFLGYFDLAGEQQHVASN